MSLDCFLPVIVYLNHFTGSLVLSADSDPETLTVADGTENISSLSVFDHEVGFSHVKGY